MIYFQGVIAVNSGGALNNAASKYFLVSCTSVVLFFIQSMTYSICSLFSFRSLDFTVSAFRSSAQRLSILLLYIPFQ